MSDAQTATAAFWDMVPSPVGRLLIVVRLDGALLRLAFEDCLPSGTPPETGPGLVHHPERCAEVARQLGDYFSGRRREFDLEVEPSGTPFQRRVWAEVKTIRYGTTLSYGELAARLGEPGAARAVGAANGRNPIPIVIPCHRVVGADGSLAGYGGGVHIKAALLELEGALPPLARQPRLAFTEEPHEAG